MKFNRNKGIATMAAILMLVIFNLYVFMAPITKTVTFWIGYLFVMLAGLILLATVLFVVGVNDEEKMFMRISIVKIAWTYFVIQTCLGIVEITSTLLTYLPALIINSILTSVYILVIFATQAASDSIQKNKKRTDEKIFFIKKIQTILMGIKTSDKELNDKLRRLIDDVKYSDPMSHSALQDIESEIEKRVIILKVSVKDKNNGLNEIEMVSELLKERNQKCKLYKNIREERKDEDNSGVKYVSITVAILSVIALVVVIIANVIIPNNIYKNAMSLYDNAEYEKAKVLFKELGGYSNSTDMIEACEDGEKEEKYNEAQKLFGEKKYEDAKKIFEELDEYKDSKEMIVSIAISINEDKYVEAEKYFNSQNYVEAMEIYKSLGDYRDCQQKIETISNRLNKEGNVYYGTYKDKVIAWQVVEMKDDRILLMAKNAICDLPYNDEIKDVSWDESTINSWIKTEFINSFSEEQLNSIQDIKVDGVNTKVFLLDKEMFEKIENDQIKACDKDWWINSKAETNTNYMFVTKNGKINEDGDSVIRAKGVRPCIWIKIK